MLRPSLAVSFVLLACTLCAASVLLVNQRSAERALREATEGLDALTELEVALRELREELTRLAHADESRQLSDVARSQRAASGRMYQIEQVIVSERGRFYVREIRRSLGDLDRGLSALSESAPGRRPDEAQRLLREVLDEDLLGQLVQQREEVRATLADAIADNRRLTWWTGWGLILLGLLGAVAGTLAGYSLARGLRRRMIELTLPVQTAVGSLDAVVGRVRIDAREDDLQADLDELAHRVELVVKRLQLAEREVLRNDQLAALGQLAAGLAHELRNPLTSIKTLVEAVGDTGQPLDGRDLQVMEEELARLDHTLQVFLDYARPPRLHRERIDLRDVLEKTKTLVSPQGARRGIKLDFAIPETPLTLMADAKQLRQLVLNLVLNAFDAVDGRDAPRVTVSAAPSDDGEGIELLVRDNGPGVPRELRDRIFEPFVSSKASGTGLGLSICRRIVEQHDGAIEIRDSEFGGAEFRIVLPVQKSLSDEPAPVAMSAAS